MGHCSYILRRNHRRNCQWAINLLVVVLQRKNVKYKSIGIQRLMALLNNLRLRSKMILNLWKASNQISVHEWAQHVDMTVSHLHQSSRIIHSQDVSHPLSLATHSWSVVRKQSSPVNRDEGCEGLATQMNMHQSWSVDCIEQYWASHPAPYMGWGWKYRVSTLLMIGLRQTFIYSHHSQGIDIFYR